MRKIQTFTYSRCKRVFKNPKTAPAKPFEGKRGYFVAEGERIRVPLLPYTYETFTRYISTTTEEYGKGVYLLECERDLFDYDGRAWRYRKERDASGSWHGVYEPYTGSAFGRRGTNLPPATFIDGFMVYRL